MHNQLPPWNDISDPSQIAMKKHRTIKEIKQIIYYVHVQDADLTYYNCTYNYVEKLMKLPTEAWINLAQPHPYLMHRKYMYMSHL